MSASCCPNLKGIYNIFFSVSLAGSLFKTRCLSCGHEAANYKSPICDALKDKGWEHSSADSWSKSSAVFNDERVGKRVCVKYRSQAFKHQNAREKQLVSGCQMSNQLNATWWHSEKEIQQESNVTVKAALSLNVTFGTDEWVLTNAPNQVYKREGELASQRIVLCCLGWQLHRSWKT